ncbi:MAG: hypothetical protein FH758_09980 [Firmicutes bacterium]|nr:hypothetical protein [Bacillota bacterium]
MMKKILTLILVVMLMAALTACGTEKTDDDVKVLPKEKDNELKVLEVDELHNGRANDISSDGKKILFSWDEDKEDPEPRDEMGPPSHLYTLNLDDLSLTKMSNAEYFQSFANYSPDGEKIVFLEGVEGIFTPYIMDNKPNAEKKSILQKDHPFASPNISWSPDGNLFALITWGGANQIIGLYDQQGNLQKSIKSEKNQSLMNVTFYDNENIIYFVGDVTGKTPNHIAVKNINDKEPAQKIVNALGTYAISPDKQRLAYIQNSDPNSDAPNILKIDALGTDFNTGSTLTEVEVGHTVKMAWSPNSKYLVYSDNDKIWALNPETNDKKQLISNMYVITNVMWLNNEEVIFNGIPNEDKKGDFSETIKMYRIKLK